MDMQPYLHKLQAQYSKVLAELEDKKADLEMASQDEVGELKSKLKELKAKMEELQSAGEDKVEELKAQADKLLSDIMTAWNNLLEKLKV